MLRLKASSWLKNDSRSPLARSAPSPCFSSSERYSPSSPLNPATSPARYVEVSPASNRADSGIPALGASRSTSPMRGQASRGVAGFGVGTISRGSLLAPAPQPPPDLLPRAAHHARRPPA